MYSCLKFYIQVDLVIEIGIASLHLDSVAVDMHPGAPHVSSINKDYLNLNWAHGAGQVDPC